MNIAEEHYATAIAHSILDGLSRQLHRGARDGRLAIVTGTPGEQHMLGARMVADFLEADGWEVLLLGAGAPTEDLDRAGGPPSSRTWSRSRAPPQGCSTAWPRSSARCGALSPRPCVGGRRAAVDGHDAARPRSSSVPTSSSRTRASS